MARLDLSVLGAFQIVHSAASVEALGYDKVRALLVFLAVEGGRAHRRETLAGMFWPEQDEAAARHSLSQAIWILRKAIESGEDNSPLLLVSRATVQLNPAADHWLDVDEFRGLIDECAHHAHRRLESCRACAERLERAVALYRGSFLEGFTIADSLDFDDWVTGNREELRRQAHQAIAVLIDFHHQRGNYDRSASYARRLLVLDPWHEGAHRCLMRALAASGRRTAALAEYERFRQSLANELGVHPEQATTELHEWIRAGASESTVGPAAGSQLTRLSNLPPPPAALIGRRTELARLADLIDDSNCRLITLTGPGGIGKTSLAVQAAADAAADFAGGACFVPLAGLRSASLLPAIIAEALSLSFYGTEDPETQLVRYLQSRELLLVLDNFEHLIEESSIALIRVIGQCATGVQLLVTSRERLRLQSEWVIDLQGLPLRAGSDEPAPEDDGALTLFVQRARRARWDFALSPEDIAAAARICRLVDGVPLGIELAAAWVPVLSVGEIAAEIEQSFDFLTGSDRDLPDRHRSMRAVIDTSWSMLPPHEQRTLARLSVFRGGFTRAAAEDVAGASLASLAALVDKSLLRSLDGRHEIHELLRQYAEERLDAHANAARDARRQHGEHFLRLVAHSEAGLRGGEQSSVLGTLGDEIENIRAAWRWAVEHERFDALAPATHGLWLFSDITGRYLETGELLAAAIAAMDRRFDHQPMDPDQSQSYARLLCHRGSFCLRIGDAERGSALLERGIAILSRLDAPVDLGIALNFRAMLAHQRRDYEQERIALQESIDEFAAAGDRWGMAYSLNDLGIVSLLLCDAPAAEELCRRSLDLFVTIGDQRGTAFALRNLGVIASRSGDFQRARTYLRESVAIRDAIGHRWGVADAYIQLGIVARDSGDQREGEGEVEARACLVHAREVALEVQATDLVREASSQLATLQAASALPGTVG